MSFDVTADAYDRFMGRFSRPLAGRLADFAEVGRGQRALDVGSGPGALTAELVRRLGPDAVTAVDPSPSFIAALHERFPEVDARRGVAESLPFEDAAFDRTLAQLVVHFMKDPLAGLAEMVRVTRPDGVIAACVWDHAGSAGPLTTFWQAVRDLDPGAPDEAGLAGVREGHLGDLFTSAGLGRVETTPLTVQVGFTSFEDWWEPFTLGVGPAGAHVARLDDDGREALRSRCSELLPAGPFRLSATAWGVRSRV